MTALQPRLCIVAAVPITFAAFMAPHVQTLSRKWHVTLVADADALEMAALCGPNVSFERVRISRHISFVRDIAALVALWRLFRRHRFDLVQSITPKAGLLAMMASRLAGVPIRVHWFTGQVWVTRKGAMRWLLKSLDCLLAVSATHLLADSQSQRTFLIEEGVVRGHEVNVLAHGSVNGVDLARFRPNASARTRIRTALGLADDVVMALFVGRFNRDKGVHELAAAFARAAAGCPLLYLVIVGPDEGQLREVAEAILGEARSRAHFVEYTAEPEAYMAAADFLLLPSYREGFGSVVIEAAACGLPAVATRIYGLVDAIADGESGLLVPVRDVDALTTAMVQLSSDHDGRVEMGRRARLRAERLFAQARLTAALQTFYENILATRGTA